VDPRRLLGSAAKLYLGGWLEAAAVLLEAIHPKTAAAKAVRNRELFDAYSTGFNEGFKEGKQHG
jgi:hypothetical protein